MATVFANLAVPAADGVGAGSVVSTMSAEKTIAVKGTFTGTVTLEASNDGGATYVPVASFTSAKQRTLSIACEYLRVRRSGVAAPGTPNVDVGADDLGCQFANLPVTAGDGAGAAVDVSALGTLNSIVVTGGFTGSLTIEISQDNIDWLPILGFDYMGVKTVSFIAQYLRVVRSGVVAPAGTPVVYVGAQNDAITAGNRWDDIQGSVAVGNAVSALTNEAFRDTPLRLLFFRHDQDDSLHFVYQFSHKWTLGSTVHPHIHIIPMADPPGPGGLDIYFEGQWAWSYGGAAGEPVPADAGWTDFTAVHTVNPGDVYKEVVVELDEVPAPAWAGASANLLLYLKRAGTDPLDTYTTSKDHGTAAANVCALFSDVHYQADRFGTITEYM